MSGHLYSATVCAHDGTQFHVKWRDGWWVVLDADHDLAAEHDEEPTP